MLLRQRDFPREVWVRDELYKVRFVRRLIDPDTGRQIAGELCPLEKEIRIRQGQVPMERMRTFVHEVVHAFEEEYGFDIPHWIVEALEDPICDFILANCVVPRTAC